LGTYISEKFSFSFSTHPAASLFACHDDHHQANPVQPQHGLGHQQRLKTSTKAANFFR